MRLAGVAEVPGELDAGDFDLKGGERSSGVARGGPEALSFEGEGSEEDGEGGEGKVFDAPEMSWFSAALSEETDQENQVGEGKKREGDPEVEEKMVVERWAVGAGIVGQPPGLLDCGSMDPGAGDVVEGHICRISCLRVGDPAAVSRPYP